MSVVNKHGYCLPPRKTQLRRSTVPTAGTGCFLCFPATDPIDSVDFRSAPLNSDDFFTTGFRSRFRRKSSGKFRKISTRNSLEIDGTDGNWSELVRRNLDRNPVVKKSSEFNGTDRFRRTEFDLGKQWISNHNGFIWILCIIEHITVHKDLKRSTGLHKV